MVIDGLVADLDYLVSCESPSHDVEALERCADRVGTLAARRIGHLPEVLRVDNRPHLRWTFGSPRVLLLGHFDTVWPTGTLARWPFAVDGDRASGPGAFDMKAGIVQLFAALEQLSALDGIAVLITSDEEIGSPTSQKLIESTARDVHATLVLEPSSDGALKLARKGVGMYHLDVVGRAAHAGLEPERGINATIEAAAQILAIHRLSDPSAGTTVTPTVVAAGTVSNTVPAAARVTVDVRAESVDEMQRVDAGLQSLSPTVPGAVVKVVAETVRPPLEPRWSESLFAQARSLAPGIGIADLAGVAVGGGSDGNLTAAIGIPTLDGLGAVGGNAHAEGEWVSVSAMPPRTNLVTALIRELLG